MNHLGAKQDATFFAGVFSFLLVRQHQMGTQVLQGLNLNQTHSVCLGGGGEGASANSMPYSDPKLPWE